MRDESEALSEGIDRLLDESGPQEEGEPRDPLLEIAAALRQSLLPLPAPPEFRARLKAELLERYADNVRPFPVPAAPATQPVAPRPSFTMRRAYRAGMAMAVASAAAVALLFGYNDLHDHGSSHLGGGLAHHLTDTPVPRSTATPHIAPSGTRPSPVGAQPGDNGVPGRPLATATRLLGSTPMTAQNLPLPATGTGIPAGHPLITPSATATPIPSATMPIAQPSAAPSATAPASPPTQGVPTASVGGTSTATLGVASTATPGVTSTPQPTASAVPQVAYTNVGPSSTATAPPPATATSRPTVATPAPPSPTAIPPTATSRPQPSATAVTRSTATALPTATPPPTATQQPTVPPPSATPRPAATAAVPAPSATRASTPTSPRPTATAVPPISTPTSTAPPLATETPHPVPTATAAPRDTATARPIPATNTPVAPATPVPSQTPAPSPTGAPTLLAEVLSPTGTPGGNSVPAVHNAPTVTPTASPTLGTPAIVPTYPFPAPANAGPDSPLATTKPLASGTVLQVSGSVPSVPSVPSEGLPILGGLAQQGESALATIAGYGFSLQQPADTVDGVSGIVTIDRLPYTLSLKARSYGYQLALRLVGSAPKAAVTGGADPGKAARAFLAAHLLGASLQPTGVTTDARKISTVGFATYLTTGQYQVAGAGATLIYTAGGVLTGGEIRIVDQSGPLAPAIGVKDALAAVANGAGLVQVAGGAVPTTGAIASSVSIVYVPVVASTGDTYYLPVYHFAGSTAAGASFDVYVLALRRG